MKQDFFEYFFEDDRTELQKKTDEICPIYCERFHTVSYRDQYCVDEEQVYKLMSKSLADGIDYLSRFKLEYPNKKEGSVDEEMMRSIMRDASPWAEEILNQVFDRLNLRKLNADERYSVLAYAYDELQYDTGDEEKRGELLLEQLGRLPIDELLSISEPYLWKVPELEQLRALRERVLSCALNQYNGVTEENALDEDLVKQEGSKLMDLIFVSRYKFGNRNKILSEADFLMSEIEKDLTYLSSGRDDSDLSFGLITETTEKVHFEYKSFGVDPDFFKDNVDIY